MNQELWTTIDEYLCGELLPADEPLDAALAASADAGLRAINVAPNQGKFLSLLAQIRGAKRILEVGTLGGYSTIWLAKALPADGVLVSLELEPENARVARENIARAGYADVVTVLVGDAAQSLEKLAEEGTEAFDMVFLDADKKSYPRYLESALKMCRPGTVIVGDNVIRRGRIADLDSTEADVIGLREFFRLLKDNPRIDSTAVQTVGSKGWDGFSISLVRA